MRGLIDALSLSLFISSAVFSSCYISVCLYRSTIELPSNLPHTRCHNKNRLSQYSLIRMRTARRHLLALGEQNITLFQPYCFLFIACTEYVSCHLYLLGLISLYILYTAQCILVNDYLAHFLIVFLSVIHWILKLYFEWDIIKLNVSYDTQAS